MGGRSKGAFAGTVYWGLEAQSRLGCQARVGTEDLTVEIPKYSLNHAAEAPH